MRINLYSVVLAPALLAAAAFTAKPVLAAATYRVQVPFQFVANGKTLPAGEYFVREGDRPDAVMLEGKSIAMTWLISPGTPNPNDTHVILTFDNIGEDHMLRTVQVGPMITGRIDKKYANSLAAEVKIRAGE
jgi:hypothetical protein